MSGVHGGFTSLGVILVLFILLVIITRSVIF
ncbi:MULTISPECIES: sporulation protein YjcZ [Bacillales]|nr:MULTISPECIES: sporulation protein YjcZ [Bacillales]